MKNLPQFKELILRYESITLEEIEEAFKSNDLDDVRNILTGFGDMNTCTLCKSVGLDFLYHRKCIDCVYGYDYACVNHDNEDSYCLIMESKTPKDLFEAYKARAKRMRQILIEKGIEF